MLSRKCLLIITKYLIQKKVYPTDDNNYEDAGKVMHMHLPISSQNQTAALKCMTLMHICWLVGCSGFNGPLRQYFSHIGPSPREREKEKRSDS